MIRFFTTHAPARTLQYGRSFRASLWSSTQHAGRHVAYALHLVWDAHRGAAIGMAGVVLLSATLPLTHTWVATRIADTLLRLGKEGIERSSALTDVGPLVLMELLVLMLGLWVGPLQLLFQQILNARVEHLLSTRLMTKALTLDLTHFETADFYDRLRNAQREIGYRPIAMVLSSFQVIQQLITIAVVFGVLCMLSPLLVLVLMVGSIPSVIMQFRYSKRHFRLNDWRAPEARRSHYLRTLLTTDSSFKEITLFGLGQPLLARYHDLFAKAYREDVELGRSRAATSLGWGTVTALTMFGAYAWIVWHTMSGSLTVGGMLLYVGIMRQSQHACEGAVRSVGQLVEGGLFIDNLLAFLRQAPEIRAYAGTLKAPHPFRQGIEFRNVSFRYPGSTRWVVRDLSLQIAPNEKLALVGTNGAGKTTLVKLLTGLYEPTEGQILLDGVDLRMYDQQTLHARIGIIFQDFVRYQFTAGENIGLGNVVAHDDRDRITEAARQSGADSVIARLREGYNTPLGSWFEHGHELSGGEWQRIAVARALMRDADLVILDEPTAALDAEHEVALFERIRNLTRDRAALLISHRFSTVRLADRIAVLDGGCLTELGSHEELLDRGGTYARLFNLQAQGYH